MTREEYDEAKAVLVKQKNAIQDRIDALAEEFHSNELDELKERYEGKYVVEYGRNCFKNPALPPIKRPTDYSIYRVDNVKFVGHGFFRFDGKEWKISNGIDDISDIGYREITMKTFFGSIDCYHPDEIISKAEAIENIKQVAEMINNIAEDMKNAIL